MNWVALILGLIAVCSAVLIGAKIGDGIRRARYREQCRALDLNYLSQKIHWTKNGRESK